MNGAAAATLQSRPLQVFPAREGRWLVVNGSERFVLPAAAVALLEVCVEPRSLEDHEAAFVTARGLGREQAEGVRDVLGDLVRKGLLVAPRTSETRAPLSTIVIPTRRCGVVQRCMESYRDNARMFGHDVRFVVSEDGEANARRQQWVGRLMEAVEERVARFLLYGVNGMQARSHEEPLPGGRGSDALVGRRSMWRSYGANRNLLLLETAGEAVLTVDDDTVCEWRRSPEWRPGLDLATQCPASLTYHETMEAARASATAEPFDVLGHFGALLGPAIRESDPGVVSGLLAPSRTVAVQAGLCGDAAVNSPLARLVAAGETRARWLAAPGFWRTRAVTSVVSRDALVLGPDLMTFCAAIDGRMPLVPFSPLDRNEDLVFGTLLAMTQRDAAIRHVPWSVWHEPQPAREFPQDVLTREAGVFGFNLGLLQFLHYAKPTSLSAAAAWLSEVSEWDEVAFLRSVTALRAEGVSREIAVVENALAEHGRTPEWWAAELRAVIRVLEETLTGDRLLAGSEGLQQYLGAFGELLRHWPAMWECARWHGERRT